MGKIFVVTFVFLVFVYNLAKSMSRHPYFSLDLKMPNEIKGFNYNTIHVSQMK